MEVFQDCSAAQLTTSAVLSSALHHKPAKHVGRKAVTVRRRRNLSDGIAIVIVGGR